MRFSLPSPARRVLLSLMLLASAAAFAAQTQIAQVPLLNITGTGTVKPNLMLLFDNSGSMDQAYTPDYVDDAICRGAATLAASAVSCAPGHPPYMTADFNKQYYNPAILYAVPVKADGTFYPSQTTFTKVSNDGFGVRYSVLGGTPSSNASTVNLLTEFPDLRWCNPNNSSDCGTNTTTYTYPDATHTSATQISGGPYYYNIGVTEYCTDDTMTVCRTTSAGAGAPTNYPVAVKVRWCSDKALTVCQAKQVGAFKYPRYSTSAGSVAAYATIAIGTSLATGALDISSVSINEGGTSTTLTSGPVTATGGTTTAIARQTMANALASNINNRADTAIPATLRYLACVRTPPSGSNVPTCAGLGITLSADNIVGVVAVDCSSTTKTAVSCPRIFDASRSGYALTVITSPPAVVPSTALLAIAGPATNTLFLSTTIKLDSTTLASNISIPAKASATTAASTIASAIGVNGNVRGYVGGNGITDICRAASTSTVCLVNVAATGNGQTPSATAVSGLTFTATKSAGFADTIPITTAPMSGGSTGPSSFVRVNIVSGSTYPKGSDRTDCVAQAGVCTYQEEMTNFANWYVYYKTRLQMMKTSVGLAFAALNANYKVGFAKLSVVATGGAMDIIPADFTGASRSSWYSKLYATTTSGSTPTRPALDNIGRMFANQTPYQYAAGQEVVQFPCQQNFVILTTDGYWNGGSTKNYNDDYSPVVNNDNAESTARFCSYASGCVDTRAQSVPSLADVALHWYNGGSSDGTISLRPTLEPNMAKAGSVPARSGENTHLHMNTYTLGLGVDGVMNYDPNYDTTARKVGGDFYNLITRVATGCPWNNNGPYVWPNPDVTNGGNTVQERVDDLWHAAVNGHGKYFSASQPKEVVAGLSEALSNMQIRLGAAAAAATSTPNISLQDNDIFSDTFTTVKWYGELAAKKINTSTGEVGSAVTWTSSDTVGRNPGPTGPTGRIIKMLDTTNGTLKDVTYDNMSTLEKGWFSNKCTALAQCTLLTTAERATVNDGANLVNWLRGAQTYADDRLFRAYTLTDHTPAGLNGPIPILLGDIASSKPAYLRDSRKNYTRAGYAAFKAGTQTRPATVLTAANDGMLHAFDATNGNERWAYMPRITMKKLYLQASTTYGTNHQFSTDGSPELADVQIGGVWKTVMVAGLNGGGRGYYALDVTDPINPVALWEFCADSTVCSRNDPDLGLTFGNPQFGLWNNQWVVFLTSGYNNVPGTDGVNTGSGQGILYIVDVATGAVLKKVSTQTGDTTTPSGLAKITSISSDPNLDPATTYIYGGDNNGRMWRFDLTDATGASVPVIKMGDAGVTRPITTRPDVTLCAMSTSSTDNGVTSSATTAQRVVLFGTGRLLDVPDTTNTDVQSLFLLKDSGAPINNVRGSTMVQQTLSQVGTSSNISFALTSNPVDLSQKDGWFFDWSVTAGERMNLDPQIVSGVANVVTNLPSSSSACSVGGTSNAYQVDVCTGTALPNTPAGTILSSDSAAVGFIIYRLQNGQLKMTSTLATGITKTGQLQEGKSAEAHRVGWRRVQGE
ncbi:pilus assembly protein [Duganella margarita]|nr:PilC/PilY family type IV pilus protein [Duganella margarita]